MGDDNSAELIDNVDIDVHWQARIASVDASTASLHCPSHNEAHHHALFAAVEREAQESVFRRREGVVVSSFHPLQVRDVAPRIDPS
ncbi:hypothetical protein [Nocardia sp. NBC_01388]|uniref:hypothetical protein n=1 Tax=Nocardia sp. NBC_01388 TaxID=2903596 RepID=UPI003251542A